MRAAEKLHAASAATRAHTPRWHDRRATQSPCAAHAGARVALAAATEIDRKEAAASAVMSGAAHSCDQEQSFHSEEKETYRQRAHCAQSAAHCRRVRTP